MANRKNSISVKYLRGELEISKSRIGRGTRPPQVDREKLERIKKAYQEVNKKMSSLDYMRGEKQIRESKSRSLCYATLDELKDGAKIKSDASRKYWKAFKESVKGEPRK